jgi:hypothetical protein
MQHTALYARAAVYVSSDDLSGLWRIAGFVVSNCLSHWKGVDPSYEHYTGISPRHSSQFVTFRLQISTVEQYKGTGAARIHWAEANGSKIHA